MLELPDRDSVAVPIGLTKAAVGGAEVTVRVASLLNGLPAPLDTRTLKRAPLSASWADAIV